VNAPFHRGSGLRDPFQAFVADETTAEMLRPVAVEHGWSPEKVNKGGLRNAVQTLSVAASPSILFVDLSESGDPLNDINALAEVCEPLPAMVLTSVGVGAGTRDPADRANVVRVLLGANEDKSTEHLILLEANVDDLDPRLWPGVLGGLLDLGAADAWLTPILMKKGRPAHTLSVLCREDLADAARDRIFRDTSTLGVRHSRRGRVALDREFAEVSVGAGRVRVKIGSRDGVVLQVMPEFEDIAALAREQGRPERVILQEALAAAAARYPLEGGLP